MPKLLRRGGLLLTGAPYAHRALLTRRANLIGYWPLSEASGTVAYDLSGNGRNGAYTAVTLAQPGIGDGRAAGSFDGSTSFANIYSAGLASAFSGAEGTLLVWAKVSGAGVWTDGAVRVVAVIAVDANNAVAITKAAANNQFPIYYKANNVSKQVIDTAVPLGWTCWAITWSASGDAVRVYRDGTQVGATLTGLGVWAGVPAAGYMVLGAGVSTPAQVWSGFLAHAALWSVALTPVEVAALARV